jgi:hypothetical protein
MDLAFRTLNYVFPVVKTASKCFCPPFFAVRTIEVQIDLIMQHARRARCAGCLNAATARHLQSFNSLAHRPSSAQEQITLCAAVFIFLSRSPIIPGRFATGFVSCYRLEVLFRA